MEKNYFLFGDFKVSSDGAQFVLGKRKIIANAQDEKLIGKERWETIGYFSTIDGVFYRMSNLLCAEHIGELSMAVKKIDQLMSMLKNLTTLKK